MDSRTELVKYDSYFSFASKNRFIETFKLLLQFIQAYNEIFHYCTFPFYFTYFIASDANQVFWKCVWTFRGVYRKRYRGVLYLTSSSLQQTHTKAFNEALKVLDNFSKDNKRKSDMEAVVGRILAQEQRWIEEVNRVRKQSLMDSIKSDALEEFKVMVHTEFPAVFHEDSLEFYEEGRLRGKLNDMKTSFMANFQELNVPFIQEEDPAPVTVFCQEMALILQKKCVDVVMSENENRMKFVNRTMDQILEASIFKYKEKMKEVIGQTLLFDSDIILKHHATFRYQFVPDFTKFSNAKCRREYLNTYKGEAYKVLRTILYLSCEGANDKLDECQSLCQAEIATCFERVSQIFRESKICPGELTQFQKIVKSKFSDTMKSLKRHNAETGGMILSCAKNENYSCESITQDMATNIMEKLMSNYEQSLNALVEEELKILQEYHRDKKRALCQLLHSEIKEKTGKSEPALQHIHQFRILVDGRFLKITGEKPLN